MKNVRRIKYNLDNILLFDYLVVCRQIDRLIAEGSKEMWAMSDT